MTISASAAQCGAIEGKCDDTLGYTKFRSVPGRCGQRSTARRLSAPCLEAHGYLRRQEETRLEVVYEFASPVKRES
ncbi:hypothetical protein FHU29_004548 [Hoyosella altamirensis]|uniref:Uncharacterized protein n=1 Tax=Hoyosella altamirensis TaxID=616997 RepID=A0A839RW38_9ACTN|nr:hypothetical protein [Hoyosella altamirensis]